MTHRLLAGLEKKGCDAKRWCTTNKKINKCDSLPVCNSQVAVKNPWGLFQWLLSKMQPKRCQIQHKDQCFLRMPRLGHAPTKSRGCVCFPLGEPAQQKPASSPSKPKFPEVAPVVLWEKPPKPAGWSAIWEAIGWKINGPTKRGGGLLQWYGIFRPIVRFCHHLLLHLLDKMGLALNFLGSEFLKVVVLPCFRIFG